MSCLFTIPSCTTFRPNAKRKYKDQKFGFGGKKKGGKWNTKESHNDVSGFKSRGTHGRSGGKKFSKGGKNVRNPKSKPPPRFS